MIPHPFRYHVPDSVAAAVGVLGEAPAESVLLGGGTWVVPTLGDPGQRVANVIDLRRAGLNAIRDRGDHLHLGAMVTYADLLRSDLVRRSLPLLAQVAEGVTGGPQIQSQGTLGGSACAAKPASDIPCALLTLGAVATVEGESGPRRIPVAQLWRDAYRTTLGADEVLTGFEVPVSHGGCAYRKLKCGTGSWPIVTAGAVVSLNGAGTLTELTVAVGAAAAVPFRIRTDDLTGRQASHALLDEVAARARSALADPWSDEIAPAEYRAGVLPVIVRRAVEDAFTRAQEARHA